jgi:hypothetical protein
MTIFDRFGGRTKAKEKAGFSIALFAKGATSLRMTILLAVLGENNSRSLRDDKQKDRQRRLLTG